MSTDEILQKILSNPQLMEKYWPEIKDPTTQNVNTILMTKNIYLRYLHEIFSDKPDTTKKNAVLNLLNV